MKIGSLFVSLGFQTNGTAQLESVEKLTAHVAATAGKAALGVDALTAALGYMVDVSLNAAVALKQFALATGLSTDELQQWEFMAEKSNVSGQEMAETIKTIQNAGNQIKLGRGNIAPWQLLGVDPTQDPFTVLKNLRAAILRFPPDIARVVAAEAGISDGVFQMLRMSNLEFDKLAKKFVIQQDTAKNLAKLKGDWEGVVFELKAVGVQLTEVLRPGMEWFVAKLEKGVELLQEFVHWLDSGSVGADLVKTGLYTLAAALLAASVALTTLTATFAAFAAGLALWTIAPFLLGISMISAGVIGLTLLFQDLWVAVQGGNHLLDWGPLIRGGNDLAGVIQLLIGLVDILRFNWRGAADDFKAGFQDLRAGTLGGLGDFAASAARGGAAPSNKTVTQQNNVEVHVSGNADPHATGRETGSAFRREISSAAFQMELLANGY